LPRFVICGGWQVLCEYNGSDEFQQWYAYGNYIDEVLAIGTGIFASTVRFYIHDHLYSPVALTDYSGNVLERCEYDAYGSPTIWNADFTTERDNSNYGNPYLFTGRRTDYLDSGSLKIQYNRNRYYDYYSGRWLTHDPLGIVPNSHGTNEHNPIGQYRDGLSIYEYVRSNPIANNDPIGLSLKSQAINELRTYQNYHVGYDYYTITGLKSMIWDKLIPALEWLDEGDYFVGDGAYSPWPKRNIYLPRDAGGSQILHEAIHAHNDKTYYIDLESRKDEGIAYVAQEMELRAGLLKIIEIYLREDTIPIENIERHWSQNWGTINRIVPDVTIFYDITDLGPRWHTSATENDVSNVLKELGFKLSCEKIAEHYNNILKKHPGWKKARCPRFICTTIPFVNVKSFHLNVELHSVFK
jgi:RHS repeat-associated protein